MTRTFAAIWPVNDLRLTLPSLQLLAEEDLADMLDEAGLLLTGEPRWTLAGDRLTVFAEVRPRLAWDVPAGRAAKAYLLDIMPDAA
jgi:hypothetical protein